ncbi:MAG: hypothetical protein E6G15_12050 [Actinobacteria bacterium]|nr:MAG: hypothetical protein E6G15_12050 [Actinomycetota bacterium]
MTRETFLLVFVLGSAALAVWVVFCLPRLAPQSLRAAGGHLVAALAVGYALAPALRLVPGQPAKISVLVALFAIALPAITYMLLAGLWLMRFMAGQL